MELDRIFSNDRQVWATRYSGGWQLYTTRLGALASNLPKDEAELFIKDYELAFIAALNS